MQLLPLSLAALSAAAFASAHADASAGSSHAHVAQLAARLTGGSHSHAHGKRACQAGVEHLRPRDHELRARQLPSISGNGLPYPTPGEVPPASSLPQAWRDAYNAAKARGEIPDIRRSVLNNETSAVDYPASQDMSKVCSWTTQKCFNNDLHVAPYGAIAWGIDDGPTPDGTTPLIEVMKSKNIVATHFLIGSAIAWNWPTMQALAAITPQPHFGTHSWSHQLQTSNTDLEILGDLGWASQIVLDATGKVPMYFRPPEGDVDNRVRAIAKVLGLQIGMWSEDHDWDDWCLRQGSGTAREIESCVETAPDLATVTRNQVQSVSGNNITGAITLQHETTDQAVKAFSALYDAAAANTPKWRIAGALPELWQPALPWYNNQYGPNSPTTKTTSVLPTKEFITVTDGTELKQDLGEWAAEANGDSSSSSSGSGSSSTRSGSSAASTSRTSTNNSAANGTTSAQSNSNTSGVAASASPAAALLLSAVGAAAVLVAAL